MKISYSKQSILLTISIFFITYYLFQIYWIKPDVVNNNIYVQEGFNQRFLIKIVGVFLLYFTLMRFFSFRAFLYNLTIKIPLLYYMATVIFISPLILQENYQHDPAHLMANNLIIFAPLLFINFDGEKGDVLFTKLIKITVWLICIQLLLDLLIKFLEFQYVNTIIGGMGNANTFGLHLIIAALGLRIIYRQYLLSTIVLIFTFGTGSLICILVSILLLIQNIIIFFFYKPKSFFFIFLFVLLILLFFKDNLIFFLTSGFFSVHGYLKFNELFKYDIKELLAVKGRLDWTAYGLKLMEENPLSIIFGHPNFLPFFTGDGFYLTLLVTLGFPIFLYFVISHIYLVYRGINIKTPLYKFATYTLIIYMIFFSTNRILDYWPSGLMYLLVFTYLAAKVKNVKKFNKKKINE